MAVRSWISSVRFRNGSLLTFSPESIVVVVGPNNGGKSTLLRELYLGATHQTIFFGPVCNEVMMQQEGTEAEFEAWCEANLERRGAPSGSEANYFGFANAFPRGVLLAAWKRADGDAMGMLRESTSCLADTASRLLMANPVAPVNFVTDAIQHPIHLLYKDDKAEKRLSDGFKKAFGTDLLVNRTAGAQIPLVVGAAPKPAPGEDRLSMGYARQLSALPELHQQGDGMKSFVGALLSLAVPSRFLVLIDEPEAFLHPPQARLLGSMLPEWSSGVQLFVATHSGDVLRGLLDSGKPLHVIRIRRDGAANHISELDPADVKRVWDDSILRFSNVLDGVFHERVLVCESDSDCRFYSALVDALVDPSTNPTRPDIMFTSSGGKHRMMTVVKALVRLGVPAGVVVDIDVLNSQDVLKPLFQGLGGDWSTVEADWKYLRSALEQRSPPLTTEQVRQQVSAILGEVTAPTFPPEAADRIKGTLKQSSPWGRVRESGIAGVPSGQPTVVARRLLDTLRRHQIFVVEVGELERFVPTQGGHGPSWVSSVLDRDLKHDVELEAARAFARRFLSGD